MSKSQSFGHPSSQSRKISIGVHAERKKPEVTEEDVVKISNARVNLNKEISLEAENKGEGAIAAPKGKQSEAAEEVGSPWITKRSFYQNAHISDTVLCTNQASSRLDTSGRHKKHNGVKDRQQVHSVQFFANQGSILQAGDSNPKKFTGITHTRKGGSQEQAEEFTFATAQDAIISEKVAVADKTENRTETLRMKLWQILGTVSSPKSQPSNSQAHETDADKLKPEQFVDNIGNRLVRPRHNSDTIENGSESPKQPTSRPSTRSLIKKTSTEVISKKTKLGSSSNTKQKHQTNIYSFEEVRSRKPDGAINIGSLMSSRKKSQRKSSIIEPRKISFSESDNTDEPQQVSNNYESLRHAEKASSLCGKENSFHGGTTKDKRDYLETNSIIEDKDFHQPSESKKMNQGSGSLASAGTRDHQEDFRNPSTNNAVEQPDEFQSPTLAFKTPILSPSPCSTPRTVHMEQDIHSAEEEDRRLSVGGIRSFRTSQTSKPDYFESDTETESLGDAEKLSDCSPQKPSPFEQIDEEDDDLAEFSSKDGDTGSYEDGSPFIKGYDCHRNNFPEIHTAEKQNPMRCPTKRLRNHRGIRVDEFSPPSLSPKGTRGKDWFHEPSEQNQEDELARAVTMFALALEKFRRKMDFATKKKSSEILVSVSEGIYLQVQKVESQIQTDIGKLISLGKSKRKHLETRFEGQQEQLKLIHQKFKEDIHHHLQNCQSALEVVEAHQIEVKGTAKKQRTSHQKLVLQMEEAVHTQLNDAQRRITTIHETGRKKMLQLKHIIAECLKEGTVN